MRPTRQEFLEALSVSVKSYDAAELAKANLVITNYNAPISLSEAADRPGARVVYIPAYGPREYGHIVRSNDIYVFVRYPESGAVKATLADTLYFLN